MSELTKAPTNTRFLDRALVVVVVLTIAVYAGAYYFSNLVASGFWLYGLILDMGAK